MRLVLNNVTRTAGTEPFSFICIAARADVRGRAINYLPIIVPPSSLKFPSISRSRDRTLHTAGTYNSISRPAIITTFADPDQDKSPCRRFSFTCD